jgi:KDO2-lipid IV(A) lauroyltransferase
MKHWLEFVAFAAFHRLANLLPAGRVEPAARALARFTIACGFWRRVVYANLRIAFGDRMSPREHERLYRDNMRASWLTTLEVLRLSSHDRDWVRRSATFFGWEHVDAALGAGRGVLLLGGHFGNNELQNAVMAVASDGRYHSYTGGQRNRRVERILLRLRTHAGVQPVPRSSDATRRMIRILKENGLMGICADQNARRTPLFAPFFGKLAAVPEGMATLAVKSGCAVLFSWIERVGPFRHHIFIRPLEWTRTGSLHGDRDSLVRSYLAALERVVRERPADYFWIHKRYRTRPPSDPDPVY